MFKWIKELTTPTPALEESDPAPEEVDPVQELSQRVLDLLTEDGWSLHGEKLLHRSGLSLQWKDNMVITLMDKTVVLKWSRDVYRAYQDKFDELSLFEESEDASVLLSIMTGTKQTASRKDLLDYVMAIPVTEFTDYHGMLKHHSGVMVSCGTVAVIKNDVTGVIYPRSKVETIMPFIDKTLYEVRVLAERQKEEERIRRYNEQRANARDILSLMEDYTSDTIRHSPMNGTGT